MHLSELVATRLNDQHVQPKISGLSTFLVPEPLDFALFLWPKPCVTLTINSAAYICFVADCTSSTATLLLNADPVYSTGFTMMTKPRVKIVFDFDE